MPSYMVLVSSRFGSVGDIVEMEADAAFQANLEQGFTALTEHEAPVFMIPTQAIPTDPLDQALEHVKHGLEHMARERKDQIKADLKRLEFTGAPVLLPGDTGEAPIPVEPEAPEEVQVFQMPQKAVEARAEQDAEAAAKESARQAGRKAAEAAYEAAKAEGAEDAPASEAAAEPAKKSPRKGKQEQ